MEGEPNLINVGDSISFKEQEWKSRTRIYFSRMGGQSDVL